MSILVNNNDVLDVCERLMVDNFPIINLPLVHQFTPGLYIRTCEIPEGAIVTTRIHKTEHPFVILRGTVRVASENEGSITYEGPYLGITKPGTRRILQAMTPVTWITFHVTNKNDPDEIGDEITEDHVNPLFEDPNDPRLQEWRVNKKYLQGTE